MKSAFIMKDLACIPLFLIPLAFSAPVENTLKPDLSLTGFSFDSHQNTPRHINAVEREVQESKICVQAFKDIGYQGDSVWACVKANDCVKSWLNMESQASSIKMNPHLPYYCFFYEKANCEGNFMILTDDDPNLRNIPSNWNDRIRSHMCGKSITKELSVRARTDVQTTPRRVEKRDVEVERICVQTFRDIYYGADSDWHCRVPNQCQKVWPGIEASSVKINQNGNHYYCIFYDQENCVGAEIVLSADTPNLRNIGFQNQAGETWNDRIRSYECGKQKPFARDLNARAPTDLSTSVQKSGEQICLAVWQDTQFHGRSIDGCVEPNTCNHLVADDGSGRSFGLSSVRTNVLFKPFENDPSSECTFYKGWNCESETLGLILTSDDESVPDLNDVGPRHVNLNDQLNSFKCSWQMNNRRNLNARAESTTAVTSEESADKVCHTLYADINYSGKEDSLCLRNNECRDVDVFFGISSFKLPWGGHIEFSDGYCGRFGNMVELDHDVADLRFVNGDNWSDRIRSYVVWL